MALLNYKKVYVMAPYQMHTGGVELSHQLVDYLRNHGKDAYIFYITGMNPLNIVTDDNQVTPAYNKYNIKVANSIEDAKDNVIVIPETFEQTISYFKSAQICIWWMSVENALMWNGNFRDTYYHLESKYDKWMAIKNYILGPLKKGLIWSLYCKLFKDHYIEIQKSFPNNFSMEKIREDDHRLYHFYQATYIQQYLYSQHFDRIFRLTDYINPEIMRNVDTTVKKKNIILYNPKKGIRYTKKLMKIMHGYKFVALQGFTREQLNHLFDQAKLYIDFGPFPGKDRLPREAAVHNCCIITGRFGASRYFEDIPIYGKYKFDMLHTDYEAIKARIDEVFTNYDTCIKDFAYMRESIGQEEENFYREIKNIFG